MVWLESFWLAVTVVQLRLVVPSLYVFVEFSLDENVVEFCRGVRVTLPEPVSPETVTVNGSPCITLPESAPNCSIETVRVAEALEIRAIEQKAAASKMISFLI